MHLSCFKLPVCREKIAENIIVNLLGHTLCEQIESLLALG